MHDWAQREGTDPGEELRRVRAEFEAARTRAAFRIGKLEARLSAMRAERKLLERGLEHLQAQLRTPGAQDQLVRMLAGLLKTRADLSADRRVTAVVTSCARHDLLERTLESFFRFNTHPLVRTIVVEDGAATPAPALKSRFADQPIDWISTGERVGQIRAIDVAYARVDTPFIFHLEDDWRFLKPGFVERSMEILLAEPLCLQVWLRGFRNGEGHPIEPERFESDGVHWRKVGQNLRTGQLGFSFNPGLRRLRDYRMVGDYASRVDASLGRGALAEVQLSRLYMGMGYFAAILAENKVEGYVRHKGKDRHVCAP
jgi:hypothetical protein